jgi:hypothetical protein
MSVSFTQSEIDELKKSHATSVSFFKFTGSSPVIEQNELERLGTECPFLESIFIGANLNPVWTRKRKVQVIEPHNEMKTSEPVPNHIENIFEPMETDESDNEPDCHDGIHCDDGIHCEKDTTSEKIESFMTMRSQRKVVYSPDLPYHYMSLRHVWTKKPQ